MTPEPNAYSRAWHSLYGVGELAEIAARSGLALLLACTEFDERRRPTAAEPRMQLVFERVPGP